DAVAGALVDGVVAELVAAGGDPVGDGVGEADGGGEAVGVGVDGVGGLDGVVGGGVAGEVVAGGGDHGAVDVGEDPVLARGEGVLAVGAEQVVDGLVEGRPLVDAVAEAFGEEGGVLGEFRD